MASADPSRDLILDAMRRQNAEALAERGGWRTSIDSAFCVGHLDIAAINLLAPFSGVGVIVTEAGTPDAAGSEAVSPGDLIEYQGTVLGWRIVTPNDNGVPPDETRVILAYDTIPLQAPYIIGDDEGKVAIYDGTRMDPAEFLVPDDSDTVTVNGGANNNAVHNQRKLAYEGTIPTGSWEDTGGLLSTDIGWGLTRVPITNVLQVDRDTVATALAGTGLDTVGGPSATQLKIADGGINDQQLADELVTTWNVPAGDTVGTAFSVNMVAAGALGAAASVDAIGVNMIGNAGDNANAEYIALGLNEPTKNSSAAEFIALAFGDGYTVTLDFLDCLSGNNVWAFRPDAANAMRWDDDNDVQLLLLNTTTGAVAWDFTGRIEVKASTATTVPAITCVDADALTTGGILALRSNSADTSQRALASVHNDNALAVGATCLVLTQDSEAVALFVGQTLPSGAAGPTGAAEIQATFLGATTDWSGYGVSPTQSVARTDGAVIGLRFAPTPHASDTGGIYSAVMAEDISGGAASKAVINVGSGWGAVVFAESGDIIFQGYAATIVGIPSGDVDQDGFDLSVVAMDGFDSGAVARDGGDLVLRGGGKANAGTDGNVLLVWTGSEARGNVGIGKGTPTSALDVVGNIAVTGTVDSRDVAADGTQHDNLVVAFVEPEIVSVGAAHTDTVAVTFKVVDADGADVMAATPFRWRLSLSATTGETHGTPPSGGVAFTTGTQHEDFTADLAGQGITHIGGTCVISVNHTVDAQDYYLVLELGGVTVMSTKIEITL